MTLRRIQTQQAEIERLRAEVARLRAALQRMSRRACECPPWYEGGGVRAECVACEASAALAAKEGA